MQSINRCQSSIKSRFLCLIGITIIGILILGFSLNWSYVDFSVVDSKDSLPKRLQGVSNNARLLSLVTLDVAKILSQNVSTQTTTKSSPSSTNSVQRKVFKQENRNKKFGDSDQFYIKVIPPKDQGNGYIKTLKQNEYLNRIQIGTAFDYSNITQTVDFSQLSKQLLESISYELITFPFDQKLKQQLPNIDMVNFTNQDFRKNFGDLKQISQDVSMKIGSALIRQPDNVLNRQAEYYYYNIKYKIGQINNELPICVFSTGYRAFGKNRFKQFFKSLQRQNYTNFHVVYVDDNSPQSDIQGILKYMQQNNPRLRNKIQIIHTLQHLGAMANMYFWIRTYCKQDDIVVNIDSDDGLIGTQVFNVINSGYQNPQVWFLYSKFILTENNHVNLSVGASDYMPLKTAQYRNTINKWFVSHIRTFRYKLFSKIPLKMFLEYHLDEKTNNAHPTFYSSAVDTFQIFSLLQLASDDKYKFVTDYLYLYFGSNSNQRDGQCYGWHERFDELKSRIKTPMNKLNSLEDKGTQIQNYTPNLDMFNIFIYVNTKYKACLNA